MKVNRVESPNIEICDHCEKKVTVLWRDKEHWLLCPKCWPLYHAIVSPDVKRQYEEYLATL